MSLENFGTVRLIMIRDAFYDGNPDWNKKKSRDTMLGRTISPIKVVLANTIEEVEKVLETRDPPVIKNEQLSEFLLANKETNPYEFKSLLFQRWMNPCIRNDHAVPHEFREEMTERVWTNITTPSFLVGKRFNRKRFGYKGVNRKAFVSFIEFSKPTNGMAKGSRLTIYEYNRHQPTTNPIDVNEMTPIFDHKFKANVRLVEGSKAVLCNMDSDVEYLLRDFLIELNDPLLELKQLFNAAPTPRGF